MKFTTLTAAACVLFTASATFAEPVNLTLSGGSPGGLWSLLGAGIDRAVKGTDADSVVTYQATGGGFANIGLLAKNRTSLGLVHDAEAKIALDGGDPFKEPVQNMRAIGYMYNWAPMHFFLDQDMAEQYNIDSIDDIADSGAPLRIGINRAGNITSNLALFMLKEAGVTEELIEANGGQLVRAGSKEQGELIKDGRLDMISNGIFIRHSSFQAIDETVGVVLLDVPADIIEAASVEFGTGTMTIPAGSYSKQDADITTSTLGALLVATEDMTDETAYSLASSLVKNVDEVRAVHSAMKQLSPELLATPSVLDFHPGAERAYREADLIK